jgi:uncharacterized membrane protein
MPIAKESGARSVVKAVTYRVLIICLDFVALYVLTGKTSIALGFMLVSNVYTTVAYFLHERLWNRIHWGLRTGAESPQPAAVQSPGT